MTRRVAVVGGGIVGVAVARELLQRQPDAEVTVFEKENRLASHQTGRNSGVVHAGLYYQPGSAKALLCRRGVALLEEYCAQRGIRRIACGKVLVALDDAERARLADIEDRARANGVPDIRVVGPAELRELEPHVRGVAALHSPSTSIVDFAEVTQALAADAVGAGAKILLGHEVIGMRTAGAEVVITVRTAGNTDEDAFDQVVACGGLQSDRLAEMAGDGPDPVIMPFRGEYYALKPDRRGLVNGLVYPVPDPRYPFLGVHVTPRVDGEVLIGPNAVLALAREGYTWRNVSVSDLVGVARTPAFWRFARQHWRTGIREMAGSISKRRFVAAARAYVPDLADDDVVAGTAGIRAQALAADGGLVDDFRISIRDRIVVLRNAPSPAATSALAIAEHVVGTLERKP
ncbi:dehydrogenase [Mycolicibacterium mageritense DSM 44476 = CIP 104973]|uniref:Hydroxyglutarate oxidase n=1 Tax=Mycolicibacterium mageritense TaxID=53462 RepID=A0ABN5YHY0_MYCME|nr:L-2-hydroxyglutarate oxidase [Mycolicibacterium mageritense]MCC9180445.1 L-2-hydroxyglutarate oxidase [Mycolicibacterium mageritense]BBX37693.1 hydroxyglutarate oxidase [Mycolicibacterium mageritense]CDO25641.1 dehydrogenase [Mycolicibacterium mageritense DSM 44476 = CIP 104973]